MKAIILWMVIFFFPVLGKGQSQRIDSLINQYHRNSIYTILLEHPGYKFGTEIKEEFMKIPVPDKYDDHNLSVRTIYASKKDDQTETINNFFQLHAVPKRVVSKWFNRDKESGAFDMELIARRGYYDATLMDYAIARQSVRNTASLADAGEELIKNTFVVVNDIRYVDKEKKAKKVGLFLSIASAAAGVAGAVTDGDAQVVSTSVSSLAQAGRAISDMIAGFKVIITSYLYQLEWNDKCATKFYEDYYFSKERPDSIKKVGYENDTETFCFKYVGKYTNRSGEAVLRGLKSNEEVIRKVCARALDENILQLQKKYEPFKVKSPILKIEGKEIYSQIGKKEGVSENSKFEVLEKILTEDGKTQYKKVGIVKPVKGKIWDNRYMAVEEAAEGAELLATQFVKVGGGDFYPGMLLREVN